MPYYLMFALLAFAANSVLCRLALAPNEIDPNSFTVIRLLSGSLTLLLILFFRQRISTTLQSTSKAKGSWLGAGALFTYALGFSYAYIQLDTGSGALILFGTVQLVMIGFGFYNGERFNLLQCSGLVLAAAGLLYLLWPNISTPSLAGALLMMLAGIAWGVYSIVGKRSTDALSDTTHNFLRSSLFVAVLLLFTYPDTHMSTYGALLAVASGALASGVGYAIWYAVLPNLLSTHASVAQLSVPVLAAIGGLLFVDEALTPRLLLASAFVLGGVFMVIKLKTPSILLQSKK